MDFKGLPILGNHKENGMCVGLWRGDGAKAVTRIIEEYI